MGSMVVMSGYFNTDMSDSVLMMIGTLGSSRTFKLEVLSLLQSCKLVTVIFDT